MDRSDDDQEYPPGPIPPHERVWRHPSEVGNETWVRTEPPLTIGRGLLTTTAVIGGLLAVVVVWALLPAGGEPGVTALSTVVSGGTDRPFDGITRDTGRDAPTSTAVATTLAAVATTPPPATPAPPTTPAPTPGSVLTPPSALTVEAGTTGSGGMAVAVGDGTLLVTTAAAVGDDVVVVLASGESRTEATVVLVDARTGIALLAPHDGRVEGSVRLADGAHDGDEVTVHGGVARSTLLRLADGAAVLDGWDAESLVEGAPVVDDKGDLVGLCSRSKGNAAVLLLSGGVGGLRAAIDALLGGQAWLGIHLNDDPSGAVTVGAVDPKGPAAAAGLRPGDAIVAVDGTSVDGPAVLVTAIAGRAPGDQVLLTVRRGDTQMEIAVVLTARVPSL